MIFFTCRDLAIAAAFPLVFFLRAPSFLNLKAFISKGSALMLRQCKFQWVCLVMLGQRWSCCSHLHPKHFALLCLSFGSSLWWPASACDRCPFSPLLIVDFVFLPYQFLVPIVAPRLSGNWNRMGASNAERIEFLMHH